MPLGWSSSSAIEFEMVEFEMDVIQIEFEMDEFEMDAHMNPKG